METAGDIDDDADLKLYPRGKGKVKLELVKSTDIIPLHNFFIGCRDSKYFMI